MYSRHIQSFIETANAGSFSKAAKTLFIAPSSLIQQIDLLEQRLGLTLFERDRKGVRLTEAGNSLYKDASEIVRLSDEAVARAKAIQNGEGSIRVATSLLMKCRILPNIWSHMIEDLPGTRIDIVSLESAGVEPGDYLKGLGVSYDVMEGLYISKLYEDRCLFLELERPSLCLGIPKTLDKDIQAVVDSALLEDLDLVMMKPGISDDYDNARSYLASLGANRITDVPFYTVGLFADCEINKRAIVTNGIWEDIHPDLICIPFEKPHTIPYGLIFSKHPSPQAMRLYETTLRLQQ